MSGQRGQLDCRDALGAALAAGPQLVGNAALYWWFSALAWVATSATLYLAPRLA